MGKAARKGLDRNFALNSIIRRSIHLCAIYLRPQWPRVVLLTICMFANIVLALINPQVLGTFIDATTIGTEPSRLLGLATLYLIVAIIGQVIAISETYLAAQISLIATNQLRTDLTLHCLQLDASFHAEHTPGELIERIDGDVTALNNFFSRFQIALVGNALLLVGVLVMLFRIDERIGCALSLFTLLSLIIPGLLRDLPAHSWEAERQASGELFGFLEERLAGRDDILANGALSYMARGLAGHARMVLRTFRRATEFNALCWGPIMLLSAIGLTIVLALGIYFFQMHELSIGNIYVILAYTLLLSTPIEEIIQQLRDLQQALGSILRIQTLLDTQSVITDGQEGTLSSDGALAISFENVSFGYSEQLSVLQQISFSLRPGEVMGILGRTGSGKSTLAKLLVRLYDPDAGTICLDGHNLRTLKLDDVRQRVGMVSQQIQILHASVRDNLTLFDNRIDDERMVRTLEELGLGSWYRALPCGLDTKLAPGMEGLSAGEMQLLSFARVFLRNPGLIILDEASSLLDSATERLLTQLIDRLLAGRTAIIIAHRLATVQRADTILILDQGRCRECGAREELATNQHSYYTHLLHTSLEETSA